MSRPARGPADAFTALVSPQSTADFFFKFFFFSPQGPAGPIERGRFAGDEHPQSGP